MLQVFKNLQLFMEDKEPEDDLFDRLNVSSLFHQSVLLRIPSKTLMLNQGFFFLTIFLFFSQFFLTNEI